MGSKQEEINEYIKQNNINVDMVANFKPTDELEAIIA